MLKNIFKFEGNIDQSWLEMVDGSWSKGIIVRLVVRPYIWDSYARQSYIFDWLSLGMGSFGAICSRYCLNMLAIIDNIVWI